MNERGFFSIVGLCLLLVITLSIMAIQETEKNYSYLASDFQEEFELKSMAERGLFEAAKKIQNNPALVPDAPEMYANRRERQYPVSVSQPSKTDRFKNISVEVYGENGNIHSEDSPTVPENISKILSDLYGKEDERGIILISVASGENNAGVKKFCRALAYILEKDDYKKIYFMDTL